MSTGSKLKMAAKGMIACGLVLCVAVVCLGGVAPASAATTQHKAKKTAPPPPPLPSGPTGPLQNQVPLDKIAPVAPQVSYQDSKLTIVAPNSTLADILRAVRKQTGADIEIPSAPERVVTHLGPGPAREVVAELLNGSRFNYVLLGSPENEGLLTRVVLVAKTGSDVVPPAGPSLAEQQQLGVVPASPVSGQQEPGPEANEAEATEDNNADQEADQAAQEAEQAQPPATDQPGVKTPQEMLQEMQQRQLQLQQNQPPGQPPIPGAGMPPRPQPDQQEQ
ncbi:MAG TPA: hypothetical protein VGM18_15605 [Candidatus Sulfotelmatobacter sp.]|jgi:hypothetical protein